MSSCGKCNVDIDTSNSESISCSECSMAFHPACTKLRTLDKFRKLGPRKALWRCDVCSSETSSVKSVQDSDPDPNTSVVLQAINSVKTDLLKRFDIQDEKMIGIEGAIASLHTKYDSLKGEVNDLGQKYGTVKKGCDELTSKTQRMEKDCRELREEIRELQQYSRKGNLEIAGVPGTPREDIYFLLEQLARVLNIPYSRSDISVAHRVPSKGMPLIIVRFTSISTRDIWLAGKKRKGELDAQELDRRLQAGPVFINEHLSPFNKYLLAEARKKKRAKKIAFVWVKNGKVLVRVKEGDQAVWLRDIQDLVDIGQ